MVMGIETLLSFRKYLNSSVNTSTDGATATTFTFDSLFIYKTVLSIVLYYIQTLKTILFMLQD